jgi:hypothetical protein
MAVLRAGVAKRDITTRLKTAKIKDPLYVRALVLDDDKTKLAIVTMDTTAICARQISRRMLDDVADDFLTKLRDKVQKELKIPGCNVLVNASHTHPRGRLLCDDDEQIELSFKAVENALENMKPAKIGSGTGHEDRITINRTLRLKNGKAWTIRHTNPCPPDDEVAGIGPIDPEIGIIRIDRMDDTPLAVVYNFACHPLFGDSAESITANFPGVASRVIEENLGNGTIALFLQGASGDIIDSTFKNFNQIRGIELLGTFLGLSTLQALRRIETKEKVELRVIPDKIEFPLRTDIPGRIRSLQMEQTKLLQSLWCTTLNFKSFLPLYIQYTTSSEYPLDYKYNYLRAQVKGSNEVAAMDDLNRKNIEKYLKNIYAMEKLALIEDDIATLKKHQTIIDEADSTGISAEMQGIRIGDCILITSPAEVLVEVGLNIKKASPCKKTFIAAFSNGYIHYGPPAAAYDKGGYEVIECLLAPEWQAIFEKKAQEIIGRL